MTDMIKKYLEQIDDIQTKINLITPDVSWVEIAKEREKLVNKGYDLILAKAKEEAKLSNGNARIMKILSFDAPMFYLEPGTKDKPGGVYYSEDIKVVTYGAVMYTYGDHFVHENGELGAEGRSLVLDLLVIEKPDQTRELKIPVTKKELKQAKPFNIDIGRAVLSTFKGIPEHINPDQYHQLDIGFTSASNNPSFSNMEWILKAHDVV